MPANVPEERCKPVESAHEVWIHKLIDLSRRNSLLYFRLMKPGTLDFSEAPAEPLRELLAGETVAASKLAPNLESEVLKKSLKDIYSRALENLEGKGLSTLFLSFGMATWPALDGRRPPEAPALLLPVMITKRKAPILIIWLRPGPFQTNLVLLHVLQEQFRVSLRPQAWRLP
jgi:hypothetical protein